jgi:pectate lyase
MRFILLVIAFVAMVSCNSVQETQTQNVISFPGAEGFGRFSKGGRGGDVYHVTNLNDDGAGSLRYGIENAEGPRTIVFEVSGTIELKDRLTVTKPFLTIAGQTAPGDGITLKDRTFQIMKTHDVIVRYIRIRLGDKNKPANAGPDAIQTNGVSNIIFDHISASWGIDGIHDLRGEKFTLQWSIYGEALNRSLHEKGEHAMLGSFRDLSDNISLHHNLFHSSRNRHPSLGGGKRTDKESIVDFRNNLVFNWRGPTNLGNCKINFINNVYMPGESTDTKNKPLGVKAEYAREKTRGYVKGNLFPWNSEWTADNYLAIDYDGWNNYEKTTRKQFELQSELVSGNDKPVTHPVNEIYDLVLGKAGASRSRDAVDKRIVDEVKHDENRLIDSQDDVGGWPILESKPAPKDSDRDGMPDKWEKQNGFDSNNPDDRNGDADKDGFTNLEEYLNSLISMPKYYVQQ